MLLEEADLLQDWEPSSSTEETAPEEKPLLRRGWPKYQWHRKQAAFLNSTARFNTVPAGRRGGKTKAAKRRLIQKAASYRGPVDDAWFVACAPTNSQAKRIYWRDLKSMVPRELLRADVSESEMLIPLYNGADIQVFGMDVPERIEGRGTLMHVLLDEYGNMKREAWTAHVRPMLIESRGTADLIGAPEGRNHYYDLFLEAASGKDDDWQVHQWTTEEILPLYLGEDGAAKEIAAAKHDMDELTYRQEFLADFVTFAGRAYYPFESAIHAALPLPYVPDDDLIFTFDFNISPGTAGVIQEHRINLYGLLDPLALQRTCVIGEVYIPQNSNTPAVCRKLIADWGRHSGHVYAYGDATGGAGGSAQTEGSDWDIIDRLLRAHFGERYHNRCASSNPEERVRVNSMNSRIRTMDGTIHLLVDPKCVNTIRDYEGVTVLEGGSGELDKKRDKNLTHITDGHGYYVAEEFPLRSRTVEVEQG